MTTILLVEDDDLLSENIALDLEMRGHDVKQASNGKQALELLEDKDVELIISDIAMPEMDGMELLEHVRRDGQIGEIPFIFLTAFHNEAMKHKALKLGVDAYIAKPFQASELAHMIEDTLE